MNKWGSNHITIKLFCDKDKQKWKRSASSCEEIEMSNIWMFRNAQFSTLHIQNISRTALVLTCWEIFVFDPLVEWVSESGKGKRRKFH